MSASVCSANAAPTSSKHQLLPLLLLCTGTTVVIANQVVSNQAAISAEAQMLTLMRYMGTFGLSALLLARERVAAQTSKPTAAKAKKNASSSSSKPGPKPYVILLILVFVGFLDVGCYSLYNLGFALCGGAVASIVLAASGQIATALLSVVLLKRQLRLRHLAAVTIVTLGLVLRSADDVMAGTLRSSAADSKQAYGALLVVLSALLFSILGVIYEKRSEVPDRQVSQAQVRNQATGATAAAGFVAAELAQTQWCPACCCSALCCLPPHADIVCCVRSEHDHNAGIPAALLPATLAAARGAAACSVRPQRAQRGGHTCCVQPHNSGAPVRAAARARHARRDGCWAGQCGASVGGVCHQQRAVLQHQAAAVPDLLAGHQRAGGDRGCGAVGRRR